MKNVFTLLILLTGSSCLAQKTFQIETSFLDTLDYIKYKAFIVNKEFDIDFIGRQIPKPHRFTPTIAEAKAVNKAIQTQYANAALQQLDKQYSNASAYTDSAEWQNSFNRYKGQRPKIIKRQRQDQKSKIQNFDRYFWGYKNADNERLILIRFDPHKITYYTIVDETFVDVLTILVYNIDKDIISYAGWADYKE
ncbi:MAG: hypothetical protein IPK31_11135 [Chitinophagaceae bacterium]|nr:hypothetical protein [Chitinophagaceae bacterium]